MQDPTTAFQVQAMKLPNHFPELEQQLKCPRCDSTNTKFCYYNNYNLSQPRHFCKNCRRYWTKGGALRNIPVGGGSRKSNKRSSSTTTSSSSTKRHAPPPSSSSPLVSSSASHVTSTATNTNTIAIKTSGSDPTRVDQDRRVMNIGGSFSSLLGSSGHFGTLLEGLNSNGSGMKMVQVGEFDGNFGSDPGLNSGSDRNPGFDVQSNGNSEGFLAMQHGDSSCWNGGGGGGHGWSDLAMYTPSPSFR